ncbi:cyclin'cyclin' [Cryptosporidium canis]|uniref:Cyclin'cyclin n=1 Tax=Cryptosporidium canis TaxID=195482 RepID=A0A9D5DJ95_9CRYT|nr:cyclin'cyclin' [Cryptosporidium canis]
MTKTYPRARKENEETSNAQSNCPSKGRSKNGRSFQSSISRFERSLYDEEYLRIISEERMEAEILEGQNGPSIDSFNEFVISFKPPYSMSIESISYFDQKHKVGEIERFKIIYWLSLHSSRLKFQSCTFHLSCRIFDTFLIETPRQLTNPELAATAAACFLLASSTVETASDMIVPSIKQFCNAAKWLNPEKVLKRQLEILMHVRVSFGVNYTPHKLLFTYISRIKYHAILSKVFLHLYKNGDIIQILDTALAICDLIQYTPLPTSKNGQAFISILPSFILWAKLEPATKPNEPDGQYFRSLFLKEICLFSNHLCQDVLDAMHSIAKELVQTNDQLTKDYWYKQQRLTIRNESPDGHIHIFPDKKI